MPKYWGKQIFAHGRFPRSGSKAKDGEKREEKKDRTMVITMAKLRMAHAICLGQNNTYDLPVVYVSSEIFLQHLIIYVTVNFCTFLPLKCE